MKTETAIKQAGSTKALADLLEITPSAISQWGENIPKPRIWQLQLLKPEWFQEQTTEASGQAQGA